MTANINNGIFNSSLKEIGAFPSTYPRENLLSALFYFSNMTSQQICFYNPTSDEPFDWFLFTPAPSGPSDIGVVAKKPPMPLLVSGKTTSFVIADNGGGKKFTVSFYFSDTKYELDLDLNCYAKLSQNGRITKEGSSSVFTADMDSGCHLRLIWGYDMAIIEIADKDHSMETGIEL